MTGSQTKEEAFWGMSYCPVAVHLDDSAVSRCCSFGEYCMLHSFFLVLVKWTQNSELLMSVQIAPCNMVSRDLPSEGEKDYRRGEKLHLPSHSVPSHGTAISRLQCWLVCLSSWAFLAYAVNRPWFADRQSRGIWSLSPETGMAGKETSNLQSTWLEPGPGHRDLVLFLIVRME